MALVNIESALRLVEARMRKLSPGEGLEVLSYKRNRGVSLLKLDDAEVLVKERGYEEREFSCGEGEIARALKPVFRTEFPRSRKVRVYRLGEAGEAGRERKRL